MGWAGEEEGKGDGKGREGEVEGRERECPQVSVEPGPLRALLRHWVVLVAVPSLSRRHGS